MTTIDDLLGHLADRIEVYCELGNFVRNGGLTKVTRPELLYDGATSDELDPLKLKMWEQAYREAFAEAQSIVIKLRTSPDALTVVHIRRIQRLLWRYEAGLQIVLSRSA